MINSKLSFASSFYTDRERATPQVEEERILGYITWHRQRQRTSGSKFIQPDFEDSDIEFNANTYRPDFVSESRPDFASGSNKNYKNISQTSPPLFYSNDDLNFNYPSVVLNPHEASSSQAASFGRTTFPSFDRHEISRVPDPSDAHNATDEYNTPNANNVNNESNAPDLSDTHNAQNLPSAHNVKDGFNAPDPSDAHNAPNASQASKTSNPPQNLPRTSQEFVIPENTAANSQTAGKGLLPRLRRREFWVI
nr:uncharacterized protein LOC117692427 [Crassostrea gigas]